MVKPRSKPGSVWSWVRAPPKQLGAQSIHSKLVHSTAWRKDSLFYGSATSLLPKRTGNICSQKKLYKDVQGNTSHKNQKAEIMQMSINYKGINKLLQPYDEILSSHKTEWRNVKTQTNLENVMLSERNQTKGYMWCDSNSIKCPEQGNSSEQKVDWWLPGCWGRGMWEKRLLNAHRVSIWGDEKILELDSGHGCTTLLIH